MRKFYFNTNFRTDYYTACLENKNPTIGELLSTVNCASLGGKDSVESSTFSFLLL